MKTNMEKIQKFLETKLFQYLWGGLGCVCLAGVIFAGAWWHLVTAALCAVMYFAYKSEDNEEDDEQ